MPVAYCPPRAVFTHTKPSVRYVNPHAPITLSASSKLGHVAHRNSTASSAAIAPTGRAQIDSVSRRSYLRETWRPVSNAFSLQQENFHGGSARMTLYGPGGSRKTWPS